MRWWRRRQRLAAGIIACIAGRLASEVMELATGLVATAYTENAFTNVYKYAVLANRDTAPGGLRQAYGAGLKRYA